MLDVILESSVTIGLIGAVVAIAIFYAWLQTGLKQLFPTSLAIAAATAVLVVSGLMFESEREVLRRFVYETAGDLQSNAYQKVIAKIHPQASFELQEIRDRLSEVRFTAVRITAVHNIELTHHRTGGNAIISMSVYVEAEHQNGGGRSPRWVQLTLERLDGKWLIVDIEQRDPLYHLRDQDELAPMHP
jgi:hypothetical protein